MWIVRLALTRPYTFIVMAVAILLVAPVVVLRTPTDIFPDINIPVISLVFTFSGLPPEDMEHRITSIAERTITTLVNDIEHIESQSLPGEAIIKIYFQPNANIQTALSQTTAIAQTTIRQMPAGITPPLVVIYSASTVPVMQIGLTSETLSEQQIYDQGNNFIRVQLATVQGAALPLPYGGKQRLIAVDLDPTLLQQNGLTPVDVVNAMGAQNVIAPSGTAKIGSLEYSVEMNSSPTTIAGLNDLPVKTAGNGATIYMKDVAHVRDGFSPQTNIVRINGQRGVLMSVLKSGNASTLDIVSRVQSRLGELRASLPAALKMATLFDQSVFVRAAIQGVLREAIIAACLTAFMLLLFLGDWRATVIIATSIPLSIMVSVITLSALGGTINIMTLGGLALAVGILVDDATVAIENIDRNLAAGKDTRQAILDGSQQIAIPALVSTLCICIVFVPMFFLSGVARYLFVPLAEAVIFAMLASYVLSRTLVPTMAMYLIGKGHASARSRRGQRVFCALPAAVRSALRALPRLLPRIAHGRPRPTEGVYGVFSRVFGCVDRARRLHRPRLLSDGGRRADPASHARAHRAPHRGDRAAGRRGRRPHPGHDSAARSADGHRQHRAAVQRHQHDVQQQRHHRHGRCRDAGTAERGSADPDGDLHPAAPEPARGALSRYAVLLPAGRHRHADSELRHAGADRHRDQRQQPDAATWPSARDSLRSSGTFPAPWTCTCSRRSTPRRCTWRSIGRAPNWSG